MKDVIDEAKRRRDTVTLNGGGHGTDDHVAALGIGANNGTSFQMVHFRGTPEGKTQVLAGNIEVLACNVSEVAEDIKAGQFRILGVMSASGRRSFPTVRPSASRASTRCGRCRAASRRRPACRGTSRPR